MLFVSTHNIFSMKRKIGILTVLLLVIGALAYAQKSDSCRVLLKEIQGTYRGDCKDGLANGKGAAKGTDSYVGHFKNGLPEGKGRYTYQNGNTFDGYWSNGLKNGKGEFTYSMNGQKMVQKGYWKDGDYAGLTNPDEFYRVTNQSGIEQYTLKRVSDSGKQIKMSFIGAMTHYIPTDLQINTSSGHLQQESKDFSVYDYILPNQCTIHFIIRTAGGNRICNFTFDILKEGKYELVITNN